MADKKKIKSVAGFKHRGKTPEQLSAGTPGGVKMFENIYDENQNLLLDAEYNNSGKETSRNISKYSGNNLTQEEQYLDGELTERKTYEYENGKLAREKTHYLDGSFDTVLYKYDSGGNLCEKELLDTEGMKEGAEKFSYTNKLLLLHEIFDAENNLLRKIENKYAENSDEIIETTEWSADDDRTLITTYGKNETVKEGYPDYVLTTGSGSMLQQKTTRYDQGGKLIKQQIDQHHAQGLISYLTVNEYNEGGLLLSTENYTNGTLSQRAERVYSEENLLIMTLHSSAGEGISTIVYHYEYY